MTLLINPGFELAATGDATHRALVLTPNKPGQHSYWTERGEINNPAGWTAWYVHSEGQPPEHDPTNPNGWCEPETRAAPHRNPDRMHSGDQGHVMFTFYRIHKGGHFQQAAAVPGQRYRFSYWAHAWTGNSDDPSESAAGRGALAWLVDDAETDAQLQATFQAGIDPTGGTDPEAATVVWGEAWCIYNAFAPLTVEAVAASDTITVFTKELFLWPYKHCDGYVDDADLVQLVEPEPEPEPEVCPKPRDGWTDRTTVLVRADAPDDVWLEACKWANDPTRRHSVDKSWDHAFWGPGLRVRVILWIDNQDAFDPGVVGDWANEYYPSVDWVLNYHIAYEEPPVEPEPESPIGGEAQYPDPGCLIGLHMQNPKAGWLDYYRKVRPGAYKALQLGMCLEVRDASPNTLVVYRHHVNNDGSWLYNSDGSFLNSAGLRASASAFLDLYSADFAAHAQNAGMTLAAILARIDVIESLNEVIGTHDAELAPAVEFDCFFAQAVEARYGDALKAGLLTIPVGNPHESEFSKLLPVAQVAYTGGHYLAYHGYWGASADRSYLASTWAQIAGRWTEWDAVFRAHNVYPLYYLGESGVCHSLDGWNLNNVLGWKGVGPFSKYITDLQAFDQLGRQWNAVHGQRLRGMTIFCYGSNGWLGYDFEPGDLAELGAALV